MDAIFLTTPSIFLDSAIEIFREMLEEKEADQFKNWSEASKKLKDDDRFTKAPDDEKRDWYISFLKTQELEGTVQTCSDCITKYLKYFLRFW